MNTISTYLKYANLQMAAEALFDNERNKSAPILVAGLTPSDSQLEDGNKHASKFPSTLARQFLSDGWSIVAHQPDTSTGFSGTLFKNDYTGELVLSFRSTEFVDDAVRDNQAVTDRHNRATDDRHIGASLNC